MDFETEARIQARIDPASLSQVRDDVEDLDAEVTVTPVIDDQTDLGLGTQTVPVEFESAGEPKPPGLTSAGVDAGAAERAQRERAMGRQLQDQQLDVLEDGLDLDEYRNDLLEQLIEEQSRSRYDRAVRSGGGGGGLAAVGMMGAVLGPLLGIGGTAIIGGKLIDFLDGYEVPPLKPPDIPPVPVEEPSPVPTPQPDWSPLNVGRPDWLPLNIPAPEWLPLDEPGGTGTGSPEDSPDGTPTGTPVPEDLPFEQPDPSAPPVENPDGTDQPDDAPNDQPVPDEVPFEQPDPSAPPTSREPTPEPTGGGGLPIPEEVVGGVAGGVTAGVAAKYLSGAGSLARGAGGASSIVPPPGTLVDLMNAPETFSKASRGQSEGQKMWGDFLVSMDIPRPDEWPGYAGPEGGFGGGDDGGGQSKNQTESRGNKTDRGRERNGRGEVRVEHSPTYNLDTSELEQKQRQDKRELEQKIKQLENSLTQPR